VDWIAAVVEWKHFRNEVRTHWRGLTEAQLETIGGQRTHLGEQIRATYGLSQDQAERQICYFEARNDFLRATSSR
jgi:hypothetical protein